MYLCRRKRHKQPQDAPLASRFSALYRLVDNSILTNYILMKQILHKSFALKAFMLVAMMVSAIAGAWAETGTITFGAKEGSIKISGTSVTGDDNLNNSWDITTVTNDASFTQNTAYSQVGSANKPATSITFTMTLPSEQTITAFSAKFGGFSGTTGTVTLKVGEQTVGSGTIPSSNDVVVSSTQEASGTVLTVTVTDIAKGIKCYNISYTYGGEDTREEVTLSFPEDSYDATIGEDFTSPQVTVDPSAAASEVTYSSSNTKAATVDENGIVTLVGQGTTIITAEISNSTNYLDASASYTLNVTKTFAIEDGVFNFEAKFSDYGSGVELTSDGNTYITENKTWTAGNVTLVSSGKYRWWDNDGTLRFYKDDASAMTISVPEGYVITNIDITGGQAFTANIGEYASGKWTGSAQSVTLAYAASSGSVNVKTVTVTYEEGTAIVVPVPTFNPEAGEVEAGTTVEIICPDEAEGIEYSFDQSTWTEVTDLIVISEATTIYARAYDIEGNLSSVVSASYTIKEETPAYETVTLPYEETLVSSQGKFVIENVTLGGLEAVWKTSQYGMTANGNKCTSDIESWFISPLIDASTATELSMAFEQNVRYFASTEKAAEEITLWVREGTNGTWSQLTIPNIENVNNNDFSNAGTINLNEYAGKTIQLGFKYTATTTSPGRWEIKNLTVQAGEIVEKLEAGLSYSASNFTATIGEENVFPELDNPNNLTVTYSSTNVDVATVDEEGNITLLAAGQTTIKATSEEDDTYKAGSASYLLVVKDQEVAGTDKYELVTDASTLADGDIIVIAFVGDITKDEVTTHYQMALSTTQNNNNRAANEVEVNEDGTITPGSSIQQITLEGEEGAWYFNVGNGYLYAASSSANHLKTEAEADNNAKAAISISENNATILFQGNNTRNNLRFNPNNGAPLFSCYAETSSTGSLPQIYRKVASETPEVEGDVNKDGKLTIADVTALVNIILGKDEGPDPVYDHSKADVNGDEKTTIADVTALVNKILGK